MSEPGEQARRLLGGVGADGVEIDAGRATVANEDLTGAADDVGDAVPGVNATCHGDSTWSYVHVTRSAAHSGIRWAPFTSHDHAVSGVASTSSARWAT